MNRPYQLSRLCRETLLGTDESILEQPSNKTLSLWGGFQQIPGRKAIESSGFMEPAMGIELNARNTKFEFVPIDMERTY